MHSRIAARFRLNVALRQTEDLPVDRPPPRHDWFYIVDLEAESSDGLQDGRGALGLSATRADAEAVANVDGLEVIYYVELNEAERRSMEARIDNLRRTKD